MKKIALAAATLLTLSGAAYAENPNVGGQDINTVAQQQIDTVQTSSVNQTGTAYKLLNAGTDTASDSQSLAAEFRQSNYGDR